MHHLALDPGDIKSIVVVGIIGIIIVVSILSRAITRIVVARGRETTRREIAAYVAEGTIDPEQGIALLNAGATPDDVDRSCCEAT